MKFNELKVQSQRSRRRVGRGISAGRGKTAGRGTKGQNSRSGNKFRPGFEGGQNPLMQRLPKLRGGKRSHKPKMEIIYTGNLDQFSGESVDNFTVFKAGLVSSPHNPVKIVVKGAVTKQLNVKLQAASEAAIAVIQKTGGSFKAVPRVARVAKEKQNQK